MEEEGPKVTIRGRGQDEVDMILQDVDLAYVLLN